MRHKSAKSFDSLPPGYPSSGNVTSANVARTIIKAAENLMAADRAQATTEEKSQDDVPNPNEKLPTEKKGIKNGKWFQRNKWFMKEATEKKSTESPIIEDEVQGEENEPITMDYRPRQKVNLSRRSSTDSSKGKRRARRRNSGKAKQLELYSTGYVIISYISITYM